MGSFSLSSEECIEQLSKYDIDEVVKSYECNIEVYKNFQEILTCYIKQLLKKAVEEGKIDKSCFEIKARTKEVNSFKGKISRDDKRTKYIDPLSEVTDLVGIKIMLTSLKDEEIVYELLKSEMDSSIDWENSVDKTQDIKKQRKFGYLGRHLVVYYDEKMLKASAKEKIDCGFDKLEKLNTEKKLRAEIQIKTLLQHVWAEVEHKARYKAGEELNDDKKRYFDRLAALIEVADDLFKDLITESERLNKEAQEIINQEQEDVAEKANEILVKKNTDNLVQIDSAVMIMYLNNKKIIEKFRQIQDQDSFYILEEEIDYVSMKFIELLKEVKIFYTKDLDGLFDASYVAMLHQYMQEIYQSRKNKTRIQSVFVLQVLCYCKANQEEREKIKSKRLIHEGVCRLMDKIIKRSRDGK